MSKIQTSFEIEEKRLYVFIENKIISTIQMFCQNRLSHILANHLIGEEIDKIEAIIKPQVLEQLEKIAPYHFQYLKNNMSMRLMEGVYYNAGISKWQDYDYYQWNKEYQRGAWYWVIITQKDFEDEGFSLSFTKRLIENWVESNILRKKRGIGGYLYSLFDPKKLADRIGYVKKVVEMRQDHFIITEKDLWIFDKFDEKDIKRIFDEIKEEIFQKIIDGKD